MKLLDLGVARLEKLDTWPTHQETWNLLPWSSPSVCSEGFIFWSFAILIKKLVLELSNEGFDVEGFLCEEGVMGGNYGLIEFDFFNNIDDIEIKDYLIDYLIEE